jgi:hypothetical protein
MLTDLEYVRFQKRSRTNGVASHCDLHDFFSFSSVRFSSFEITLLVAYGNFVRIIDALIGTLDFIRSFWICSSD